MQSKQIYAAVELTDHEVRLVIGEFHETRFNILRVEKVKCNGIVNKLVVNEQAVVASVASAINLASDSLGYRIRRVLLSVPSLNFKRCSKRVNVFIEANEKYATLKHVQMGIKEATSFKPDGNYVLVNIGCIKYINNGITSRKMPIGEICDLLTMDVDLLYADRDVVFSYARVIEKAGLEILDICIDSYAIGEEAAVFEQTVDKFVVLVDLSKNDTTLSLFSHGKLLSTDILEHGYNDWLKPLEEKFKLSEDTSFRLVCNNATLVPEEYNDSIIYIYAENKIQKQITNRELNETIDSSVIDWIDMVNSSCEPIVEKGTVRYIVTGEGMEIHGLENIISKFNSEALVYVPQTLGGRNCSLVTCLGLFYAWKSKIDVYHDERISADLREVDAAINAEHGKLDTEHGFTKKLKNILLNDK
ncbi:MAG: cell division protein FtsA [Erysipelotrichaceae bacterium]